MSIEWTDVSWNPVRGCRRVSEGCRHCYAERTAARFSFGPGAKPAKRGRDLLVRTPAGPYHGLVDAQGHWTGHARLIPEKLSEPLHWRKPRRVFVNSMSDLFHEDLTSAEIASVFRVMGAAPDHTFQVLTKRVDRMFGWLCWAFNEWSRGRADFGEGTFPLTNVHLGVSVEDQACAERRIPKLLSSPAHTRWVSAEPLLEALDLRPYLRELDWVVVGGESGPGARPCDVRWIRDVVQHCWEAGVPCFVKQLGSEGHPRRGGDPSTWPADLRVREFPAPVPVDSERVR